MNKAFECHKRSISASSNEPRATLNGSAHDVDIIYLFSPISDRIMNGVVSQPLWSEEDFSATEHGGSESLTAGLDA